MASTPMFPATIKFAGKAVQNSDSTNIVDVFTAGASGSKIEAIFISSTDTSARDMKVYVNDGTTDFLLSTFSVPANAGNVSNTGALNPMQVNNTSSPFTAYIPGSVDALSNKCLYLQAGHKLRVAMGTQITASKTVQVLVSAGDF